MGERTFSILKPDAVFRNFTGIINDRFERAGLQIIAQKRMHMTYEQAASFYAVHNQRPFFKDFCTHMSSGPIVVQVLEGQDAIALNRTLMGATDPEKADADTIRKDFGLSIDHNTVHGSDSAENAAQEIAFFFAVTELLPAHPGKHTHGRKAAPAA